MKILNRKHIAAKAAGITKIGCNEAFRDMIHGIAQEVFDTTKKNRQPREILEFVLGMREALTAVAIADAKGSGYDLCLAYSVRDAGGTRKIHCEELDQPWVHATPAAVLALPIPVVVPTPVVESAPAVAPVPAAAPTSAAVPASVAVPPPVAARTPEADVAPIAQDVQQIVPSHPTAPLKRKKSGKPQDTQTADFFGDNGLIQAT